MIYSQSIFFGIGFAGPVHMHVFESLSRHSDGECVAIQVFFLADVVMHVGFRGMFTF